MIDIDVLLTPIRAEAPAGDDLRYDPVYDLIQEARTEDDPTLPAGSWGRQPKRADLPLVLRLTRDALTHRSKDLWLAVWMGHAELLTTGIGALPAVLRFLLTLQQHFPDTLYPEMEEGDAGARSAPLQWGLEQYAGLLTELPSVAPGVSYHAYKAARLGTSAEATESLEAALASTTKAYFVGNEASLAEARRELEPLYLYCEEFYGQDGPSFAKLRRTVEEVHGLVAGLLRERRELEPDAPELPDAKPSVEEAPFVEEPVVVPALPLEAEAVQVLEPPVMEVRELAVAPPLPTPFASSAPSMEEVAPQSREEAILRIARAARFLVEQNHTDPAGYVLLASRCWAEVLAGGNRGLQAPASERRLQLRTLRREERWSELLQAALIALAEGNASRWLDVHRDVWLAASQEGATLVAKSAIEAVRLLLAGGAAEDDRFEDDTPIASEETRQWLRTEVLPEPRTEVAEEQPASVAATEEKSREQKSAPPIAMGEAMTVDLLARATDLASGGDLQSAVALLMADGDASVARRKRFFRKLEIAKLCFAAGAVEIARCVLERLRLEVAEYDVVPWEGPQAGAEVLHLLLQCQAATRTADLEAQTEMLAELCALDPLRALQLQGGR